MRTLQIGWGFSGSRSRSKRASIVATMLCCAIYWSPVSPAAAHNWFGATNKTGCDSPNQADNPGQNYEYTYLTTRMANATDWARTNVIDPTRVDTWIDQTPDEHTDVLVTDTYYHTLCGYNWVDDDTPSGVVGLTTCEKLTSVGNCDQHLVRYDLYFTDNADLDGRRGLACHENGHALGLAHPEDSGDPTTTCMKTGYPRPLLDYSSHDKSMLGAL